MPVSILIVEDHTLFAGMLVRAVRQLVPEAKVRRCGSLSEALSEQSAPDLVLLDMRLPDNAGLGAVTRVKRAFADARIVLMTGDEDIGVAEAMAAGADVVLLKRWEWAPFANSLKEVLQRFLPHAALAQR